VDVERRLWLWRLCDCPTLTTVDAYVDPATGKLLWSPSRCPGCGMALWVEIAPEASRK